MASPPLKNLREHLHEQQKPFALEIYIAERRILLNKKPTEKPCSCKLDKKRIVNTREYLKFTFYKLVNISSRCHGQQVSRCCKDHKRKIISSSGKLKPWKTRATKGYSKLRSLVAFLASNKFTIKQASAVARTLRALAHESLEEVDADLNRKSQCKEENEQHSPVSVLDEFLVSSQGLGTEEGASTSSTLIGKNSGGESIISVLLWELLTKTLIENHGHEGFAELREITSPGLLQNPKKKRELQQQKQLLLDCVKEAIEIHGRKHKKKKLDQQFISLQEVSKFIAEQVCSWRKENAAQRMKFDGSKLVEEWDYLEELTREIAIEIGDNIMDQIILEVIDLLVQ